VTDPRPYADTARVYREAGWRGVLPLPPKAKFFPPVGFTGRRDVDPDDVQIDRWVHERPQGNIALRLPDNVLGIDVDDYDGKAGARTLAEREAEWGLLPATWKVGSRNGLSGIRMFIVPTGMAWPGQVGDGIETIHRGHRYAVVQPSVHPNGGIYRWTAPDGTVDGFTIPRLADLAELPDEWVMGLSGGRFAKPAAERADADPEEVRAALNEWATPGEACRQVAARVGEATAILHGSGSRHDGIRDAMLPLLRLGQTGHSGVAWALEHVKQGFVEAISNRANPTEAAAEFYRMQVGGVLIILADLRPTETCSGPTCEHDPLAGLVFDMQGRIVADNPVPASTTLPATPEVTTDQVAAVEAEIAKETMRAYVREEARERVKKARAAKGIVIPPSVGNGRDYLNLPDEQVEWVVHDLLPSGGNATLTAQFKTGKTTLMGELVRSLCDGEPFLGKFKVRAEGRVALFNYELSRDQQKRWLQSVDIVNPERFSVWDLRGYRMPLTNPAVEDMVVAWLVEHEIETWIIDPFARAFVGSGDENDNGDVSTFLDTIDVIKRKSGVASVVMPVHTGRTEAEEGAEHARGASRLDDWPDVRWLLTRGKGQQNDVRYFRATGRDVEVEEESLTFEESTRRLTMGGWDRSTDRLRAIEGQIVAAVTEAPGMSQRGILDTVEGRQSDIKKAIKRAVDGRRLIQSEREGRGGGYSYYPFESRYFTQPGEGS